MEDVCSCQLAHLVAMRSDGFLIDMPGAKELVAVEADEELWKFICNSPHWRRPALAVARTFVKPPLNTLSPTA